MKNLFNKEYFESGIERGLSCYSNYRWIPELTIPMCSVMISHLGIGESERVLDYGCAKGYTVKAMRLLHRECYGVDISEYALRSAPTEVSEYLSLLLEGGKIPYNNIDWTIAKDVLEHVPYDELSQTLSNIREITKSLFVIVPLGENGKYEVPAYELGRYPSHQGAIGLVARTTREEQLHSRTRRFSGQTPQRELGSMGKRKWVHHLLLTLTI
jgi:SAM-dependent methyltransferase